MNDAFHSAYVDSILTPPEARAVASTGIAAAELIQLCAADTELFGKTFFPRSFRQDSPIFARSLWDALEGPQRLVNAEIFRGGSKTTRCRVFVAKRLAYGISHTVLFIGKSEGHSRRSIRWLMRQIEFNHTFADTYQLRRGTKWTDVECEIFHGVDDYPITVIGMGITGSIRGINQDDFRPDLIILDDIHDEENSATAEQRQKISELVYGAVLESLAPESETTSAKLVNLFTPLNREDIGTQALEDRSWHSIRVPIWTPETLDLPTHLQESIWPARWSSAVIRKEKEAAASRNKLSTFLREKELRLIAPETAAFRLEWLKRFKLTPDGMAIFLAIDPVPPPSEKALKGGIKTDFETLAVVGIYRGDYYILELSANRGHDPSWTTAEFFRLALKWRPRRIFVETINYQRTLKWILEQEMKRRAIYFAIEAVEDQRSKSTRIIDALNGTAAMGHLFLPENIEGSLGFQMFLQQFSQYPFINHDDALDVVATAVTGASGRFDNEGVNEEYFPSEEDYPRLAYSRGAP